MNRRLFPPGKTQARTGKGEGTYFYYFVAPVGSPSRLAESGVSIAWEDLKIIDPEHPLGTIAGVNLYRW
jgi:hypothetical protein